jgi:RND superfamily putative drug exporter
MSRFLYDLGRRCARHPWRVLGAWLVVAALVLGLKAGVGGTPTDNFKVPGVESQKAVDLLRSRFPILAHAEGQVVFHARTGTVTTPPNVAAVRASITQLARGAHVSQVSDPFDPQAPTVSRDAKTAFAFVRYDVDHPGSYAKTDFERAAAIGQRAGLEVEASSTISEAGAKVTEREAIGVIAAVVILLIAFGSLVAMGVPIATAIFGLVIGLGVVSLYESLVDVPTVAPKLATMIGLGVGIDYALFIVTRYRQNLSEGVAVDDAVGRAIATSGSAVLFAGMTVVIAISGLQLAGLPAVATMGYSAAIVVAVAVLIALTLLPALLGVFGSSIDRIRLPVRTGRAHHADTVSGRWAHLVGQRPWRFATLSLLVLLILAAPVLSLRLAMADDGTARPSTTERRAYDLLTESFGSGVNGQLHLVARLPAGTSVRTLAPIARAVASDPGIVNVSPPILSPTGDTAVLLATPRTSPQDAQTATLVRRLRDRVIPDAERGVRLHVLVGGHTAANIDVSQRISDRLALFIAAVVLLSVILLMIVFRSILVPLKAAVMNMLSIGAAYGVIVAVFQWGWCKGLFGIAQPQPIDPFVPMIMFAVLFGLSMDYEVFLLSRIREEYVRSGDSHSSVVNGLGATARVIMSAATIMVCVFGAFVFGSNVILKMFGLGLASAVLIDATIVRMVLVPATMSLLGGANWWLPRWLDRILPHVDLEGDDGTTPPAQSPAVVTSNAA